MNTITIDSNIYQGAEMYAKLHNISLKQMVENFLMKFQVPATRVKETEMDSEEVLDALDENLMKQCFELAHQEYLEGKGTPNSEIVNSIKAELGWR